MQLVKTVYINKYVTINIVYNDTDLYHCLMSECIGTEGAKQTVMIKYELKVNHWEMVWIHLRNY